jgi:hypothetical protein
MHKQAQVGSWALQLGSVVLLEAEAEDEEGSDAAYLFGLVQCMWEDEDGEALAQVRGGSGSRFGSYNGCPARVGSSMTGLLGNDSNKMHNKPRKDRFIISPIMLWVVLCWRCRLL